MSCERASTLPVTGGERALGWQRGCASRFGSLGPQALPGLQVGSWLFTAACESAQNVVARAWGSVHHVYLFLFPCGGVGMVGRASQKGSFPGFLPSFLFEGSSLASFCPLPKMLYM